MLERSNGEVGSCRGRTLSNAKWAADGIHRNAYYWRECTTLPGWLLSYRRCIPGPTWPCTRCSLGAKWHLREIKCRPNPRPKMTQLEVLPLQQQAYRGNVQLCVLLHGMDLQDA